MTSETNLREYVVTLHNFDDLESFYTDMETEGGDLYIPSRAVDCYIRRPISRNTHYMLSNQEAEQLRQDPRVLAVELTLEERGLKKVPAWTQYSTKWSKADTIRTDQLNWGLLRVTKGEQIPNWGFFDTLEVEGTVTVPFSGKNVDVLILDGTMQVDHPEFAVNKEGTGGSRVVQYNWFQHDDAVLGGTNPARTYSYTPGDKYNDYHGSHVGGTVAGNTQGWARDANIYNMYTYGSAGSNIIPDPLQFDYIRMWHSLKPTNPATGRKNPTIINCSWAITGTINLSTIMSIVYRGITYTGPFTIAQARSYGMVVGSDGSVTIPTRDDAIDQDIRDCINDGIIIVAAAGNDNARVDIPNGPDYNNSYNGNTLFYQRGNTPNTANVISVGAIGPFAFYGGGLEEKAYYSNCGPRIDVFAPGTNITSSVNNNWKRKGFPAGSPDTDPVVAADSRNATYKIATLQGTSYASPQVAGLLATMLEVMPSMTPSAAMSYIVSNAATGQMYNPPAGTEFYDLQGATPRYLFAKYPTTMAIASSTATATPSQTVTYTITMTGAPDGSLVYLTDSGTSSSTDFVDGVRQFVRTITGGAASLSRTVSAGITGSRTSILQLRTGGYNGNIQATASTVTVSAAGTISSSDATLSALTISSGTLIPTFSSNTLSYTASVVNGVSSVTVTPTRTESNATITVNGGAVTSGSASSPINLNSGSATITIVVTAQDGTTKTYTVAVSVGATDFASTSGSFTIDAQGKAFFTVTPSLDSVIEGAETFTLSIRTGSITGNVVKTSDTITINDA